MTGFAKTLNKLRERVPTGVDVLEDGDEVVVVVELPGFSKDGVDLRFRDGELEIEAERRRDVGDYRVVREERPLQVSKSVPVPVEVEGGGASAEYRNGLLRVRLPKVDSVTPESLEDLEELDYGELQELAKEHGLKSTVSRNEMERTLAEELGFEESDEDAGGRGEGGG